MDSPLAKALLAKRVDDEVVLNTSEKTTRLVVVSIRYELQA
jgi:transcription elongation GreA/GreB family factor